MIDIHCHILPNIDDGPPNDFDFLMMANQAVKNGITHAYATPHHLNGLYFNPKEKILKLAVEYNTLLEMNNIPLQIHPGQELRIHREIFQSLERNEILTLDNKGKYLLLELPSREIPDNTQEVVYELLLKGLTPIFVHPERNRGFHEDHNLLFDLAQEGALFQLTAGSIVGQFGKKIQSFSEKIIEHKLAHFIATDAHNIHFRGSNLKEAYEWVTNKIGIHHTFYLKENTELLLTGKNVHIEQPVPFRKRFLRIF
ncbi:tyrosine-protein phosphatase [Neobacillus niacini]|uniref:tyrosine-protein phosphatase n=1 Tax=Neobacillus niacini TaxID=86668 RepID=UPI0021CB342D|nr:CpsB/CapC family capsule biosynthesis tyrosine phosphatase [Neobacillus niacini]MCM3765946.1 tyrosine protein phosphatase [Neobacillus niacini]